MLKIKRLIAANMIMVLGLSLMGSSCFALESSSSPAPVILTEQEAQDANLIDTYVSNGQKVIIETEQFHYLSGDTVDEETQMKAYNKDAEAGLTKIGSVIVPYGDEVYYVDLAVEEDADEAFIDEFYTRVLEYDYDWVVKRENSSINAAANAWDSVASNAKIDGFRGLDIRHAYIMYREPSRKVNQFLEYNVEANVVRIFGVEHVMDWLEVSMKTNNGVVQRVSPSSSSGNYGSVSISYPWGISYSYDFDESMSIKRVSGGIGSKDVRFKVTPRAYNLFPTYLEFAGGIQITSDKDSYSADARYYAKMKVKSTNPGSSSTGLENEKWGGYVVK